MSAKPAAPSGTDAPKKSKKMLFIIVGAVIALAGAGGGYFYYASAKKAAAEAAEDDGHASAKKGPAKAPIFLPLDAFTVNLADTHAEKMAQIAVTLKLADQKTADEIKVYMPAIRHNILKVIAAKESRLLLTNEGKDQLAHEIAIVSAEPLGWEPPEGEGLEAKPAKAEGAPDAEKTVKAEKEEKSEKADKADKAKAKKGKKKAPPPNPVEQVHFSQFIVQ